MTDTTNATDTWGISLQLGEEWFQLPVGDQVDSERLAAQVDARIGREPRLLDRRQKLIDMLAYFTRDAHDRGAIGAGLRWALDELDGVSVATIYTSAYDTSDVRNIHDLMAFLETYLAFRHGSDRTEPVVEIREIPMGEAVRVQVISDTDFAEEGTRAEDESRPEDGQRKAVMLETIQYHVPVPGQPVLLQLTFSTPNLAGAERLVAEFDLIMEGLHFTT